ncbi:MAG: hypothetical protein ABFS12_01445 [Bacteroidota bacterium]
MRKVIKLLAVLMFLMNIILFSQNLPRENNFSSGLQIGYYNGFSIGMNALIANFAEDFPLAAKIGFGYTSTSGGNALDARKIFINNNTNGVPDESGDILDFRFDFLYNIHLLSKRTYLVFGPRYTMFTGFYSYIGGNEEFEVTSDQWGVGTGLESYFRMSSKFDLVLHAGYDFFFSSDLHGHDTTYNPDDVNVNPREDYKYSDADAAINQPKHMIRLMIGFNYNFN